MWIVLLVAAACVQPPPCEPVALADVPARARTALKLQAGGDGGLEDVCRVSDDGVIAYRARGRGSDIAVEVSETGDILWRLWDGRFTNSVPTRQCP